MQLYITLALVKCDVTLQTVPVRALCVTKQKLTKIDKRVIIIFNYKETVLAKAQKKREE